MNRPTLKISSYKLKLGNLKYVSITEEIFVAVCSRKLKDVFPEKLELSPTIEIFLKLSVLFSSGWLFTKNLLFWIITMKL